MNQAVSGVEAKENNPTCSFRAYLLFPISGAEIRFEVSSLPFAAY